MKFLIVTPRIPYPPFRGDKLKIFNIAKILSRNNYVKIITFHRNHKDLELLPELEKNNIRIETIFLSIFSSIFNVIKVLFSSTPFQVAYYKSPEMSSKLQDLIEKEKFDVVYFHLIRSAQYLQPIKKSNAVKVIDFTDAVSLYLKRYSEVLRNPFKKLVVKNELSRIEKYESVAQGFNTLFVCSEIDRKTLLDRGVSNNIRILNNGIDLKYFTPDDVAYQKHRIIFTGNMPYFANYDAVLHFAKDIFPLVLQQEPESKFYIVGQKPPAKIRNLERENIIVTGFVPDIKREYLLSEVNVAPIRFGAGTLNKILESIALGVPVVATSLSVAGMQDELKKIIYIADSPAEFAEKIIYIFKNPHIRSGLMEEGRNTISRLLGWEQIVQDFENYIKEKIVSE